MEKYDKIKEFLRAEALKPESRYRMPTVQELKQLFGVSQAPVCRAIRDLVLEGVVKCRRGSGMVSCGAQPSRMSRVVKSGPAENGNVLLLYTDYFAESLWKMKHTIMTYSGFLKLNVIERAYEKNSDIPGIVKSILATADLRGIVLSSGSGRLPQEALDYLSSLAFPVVMVNSNFLYENCGGNVTILTLDSVEAGRLCIDALYTAGHRNFGYIRNEPEDDLTLLRKKTLLSESSKRGMKMTYFSSSIKPWEDTLVYSAEITKNKLEEIRASGMTALIYYSGFGALAGMRELMRAGVGIPEEISIITESDDRMLAIYYPACTAVVGEYLQPCRDALDIIVGKTPSPGVKRYGYRLIERETIKNKNEDGGTK